MSEQALVPIDPPPSELAIQRAPDVVLAEAQKAAQALKRVIDSNPKPVIFNGERYLEFEDWLVIARFYGVTAKVVSTNYVEFGDVRGFEARAVAFHVGTGQDFSAAESLCLNDEPNWQRKPLFQLKSMAQTRACAKAMRNVFGFIGRMAGFKTTPAEEMEGVFPVKAAPAPIREPQRMPAGEDERTGQKITDPQRKRLYAIGRTSNHTDDAMRAWLKEMYGLDRSADITRGDYDAICNRFGDTRPLDTDYAQEPGQNG